MNRTLLTIIFFGACIILSANAVRSILESYSVGSVYQQRKVQTEKQYMEVIKKKNELDYINSPFFVEKQLRESLNYYRKGEKLLVFTQSPTGATNGSTQVTAKDPLAEWVALLEFGIQEPLTQ